MTLENTKASDTLHLFCFKKKLTGSVSHIASSLMLSSSPGNKALHILGRNMKINHDALKGLINEVEQSSGKKKSLQGTPCWTRIVMHGLNYFSKSSVSEHLFCSSGSFLEFKVRKHGKRIPLSSQQFFLRSDIFPC